MGLVVGYLLAGMVGVGIGMVAGGGMAASKVAACEDRIRQLEAGAARQAGPRGDA